MGIAINMKLIFILFIMNNFNFLDYLGKSISDFDSEVVLNFEDSAGKSYRILDSNTKSLFDNPIRSIFLRTDSADIVVSITIYFPNIPNESFYDNIIKKYGEPKSMLKEDVVIAKDEFKGDDNSRATSNSYSTKEVAFKDNPSLILWQNEDIKISMIINYFNRSTKILITQNSLLDKK